MKPVYQVYKLFIPVEPVVEIEYLQPELVDPNSQMEGIHFHFIELSKFMKNGTFDLKNPLQAWMKFFAETEYFSTMPIKHYETFEELKKAIEMLDESNFTEGQLYAYDKYMDNIRTQKSIEAYQRETGLAQGRVAGRVEGRTEGKSEGIQLTLSIINELKNGQLNINQIAEKFQVTEEVVAKISDVISNSTLL